MNVAAGTITIQFVADVSAKKLAEDFSDFFVKYGTIHMTNMNKEVVEMQIHSHEYEFDEESGVDELSDGYEI